MISILSAQDSIEMYKLTPFKKLLKKKKHISPCLKNKDNPLIEVSTLELNKVQKKACKEGEILKNSKSNLQSQKMKNKVLSKKTSSSNKNLKTIGTTVKPISKIMKK